MWVPKKEYIRLITCEKMCLELEKEVQRLAELISSEVTDCKVGVWCKDCEHYGHEQSKVDNVEMLGFDIPFIREIGGTVQYCKKHLHEFCSEFEQRKY